MNNEQPGEDGEEITITLSEAIHKVAVKFARTGSVAFQIEKSLADIATLQSQGVGLRQIVAELNLIGIKVSFTVFQSTLYRVRQKIKNKKKSPSTKSTTSPSPAQPVFEVAAPAPAVVAPAVKEVVAPAHGDTQQQGGQGGKSKVKLAMEKSRDDPSIDELFQGR